MNETQREALAVANIRKRAEERAAASEVGGVREWFDIAFLLKVLDNQANLLKQAHFLADQGIDNSGAVNAYQLKAVLDGERTVGDA